MEMIMIYLSNKTGALSSDMRYLMRPSLLIFSCLMLSWSGSNMLMISITLLWLYSG